MDREGQAIREGTGRGGRGNMRKKIREAALVRGKVDRSDDGHLFVWILRTAGAAFVFQSHHFEAGIVALLSATLHPIQNLWEKSDRSQQYPSGPRNTVFQAATGSGPRTEASDP